MNILATTPTCEEPASQGVAAARRLRIDQLAAKLSSGMFEREEVVAVALLGMLSGQCVFLYGPPGTAKSLVSRRIACAFEQSNYFECLMNRFTTPEDVFGPVSIKALKEDCYQRRTNGYLPQADVAFLDEIWKSGPAILNTLLTLINERLFRNGAEVEKAPLKALIAASNETPTSGQGLEALYDRFVIRMLVGPIERVDHFEALLDAPPATVEYEIPEELRVSEAEWSAWRTALHDVRLSAETLQIIAHVRAALAVRFEELGIYVSDRRWQKAAELMKAAAFLSDRKETTHSEALLLMHCLWTTPETRAPVEEIVVKAVRDVGFESGVDIAGLDRDKDALDAEIHRELYHTAHVYETEEIGGVSYFKNGHVVNDWYNGQVAKEIYVPAAMMKTSTEFHPVDVAGNELTGLTCTFDKQGVCKIRMHDHYRRQATEVSFTPKILFRKGDRRANVNPRLIKELRASVGEMRETLRGVLAKAEQRFTTLEVDLSSPFVPQGKVQIAYQGVSEQIERLKQRIADCDRLEALCE